MTSSKDGKYIRWFEDLTSDDVPSVGGKNASLGEMIRTLKEVGVRIPDGFATTSQAYWEFIEENDLSEKLQSILEKWKSDERTLQDAGKSIRRLFRRSDFPDSIEDSIKAAYHELSERYEIKDVSIAARSSATAEDLPEASFAGQQETYLNVTGEEDVIDACRKCYASLFTDRAITYREEHGFNHMQVALSVGVQKMVRSDKAGSGVMFTIDTETGFPDVVVINASWGLGENVVQGAVTPDEYRVFTPLQKKDLRPIIDKTLGAKEKKMVFSTGQRETTKNVETSSKERHTFVLKDDEILQLSHWATAIEDHYDRPMDIEWAKDGKNGGLMILQARPETVQSQKEAGALKTYTLKEEAEPIVTGLAIGEAIASGEVCVIESPEDIDQFEENGILVTGMTDPDWVPIMKQAAGIITDHGGRTSHAAIVSRELGIPAVVGTHDATQVLRDGQTITLSCAGGETGLIYDQELEFETEEINLEDIPGTKTQIMMNIASPGAAFRWWKLPVEGVGLARMEFVINNVIKIHPLALVRFDTLEDKKTVREIEDLTGDYDDKSEYFIDHLARGISKIAAAQHPNQVIVRMSDFKTNEYADLIGGNQFEPDENNPMLGFRGASRYYSDRYRDGFALECKAIHKVREEMGFSNVVAMIPFCRTPEEADRVMEVMSEFGLERGKNGLEIYVMIEIPSNVILAEEFAQRYDGFSIGTNDLTQLTLGVDRDSEALSELFDERNEAVKRLVSSLIETAHENDCKVGICGQAPSDYPDFAAFLVKAEIDSMSLNPDSVIHVKQRVSQVEEELSNGGTNNES